MSASYPTSIKSFASRSNGQTIDASHVGDLQDEVNAIETGLKNGFAHDLLFTDATYDIGKSGATRPRDLFLSRNLTTGGSIVAATTLTVGTDAAVTGVLNVTGAMASAGSFNSAAFRLNETTPSAFAGNQDNYAPTGLHTNFSLRLAGDANRNITGLDATGATAQVVLLRNCGAFTITLVHDATSTAANRFFCPTSTNLVLDVNDSALVFYSTADARWIVIGYIKAAATA